ncbi:cyclin [Apiospora phragmitis]|uniref:Cyclin n=1 Tax=Apiospora phragmitis TaxID=2905665 RepID=A0ABR1VCT6_9PEZI
MASISGLTMEELNSEALERFVYQPVSNTMISYLADAAYSVIQCDPNMMPPPAQNRTQLATPPRTPSPKAIPCHDAGLPTLEKFITQLVVSSNVQMEEALRKQQEAERWATATRYPTPPSSRGNSRSRTRAAPSPESVRLVQDPSTPPSLVYSSGSSSSSYASSISSRQHSRSSTPLSDLEEPYVYPEGGDLYESPVEVVLDMPQPAAGMYYRKDCKVRLPYEISPEQLRELQDGHSKTKRAKTGRGMWSRFFDNGVTA